MKHRYSSKMGRRFSLINAEKTNGEFKNLDEFVKSLKMRFFVIPAKAGIQYFQTLLNTLDFGFHRSGDFLGNHQNLHFAIFIFQFNLGFFQNAKLAES
ncbi:MAG: hypothetical protein NTV04_11185, partial [Deltaproteobacteria bacterium]|nr:hypothetical protein [Deltaproteobacteria bacterium]